MSGLIDTPGIYELGMDEYHRQPTVGPSVSSSGLRRVENESPAHFWAYAKGLNPDAEERPGTGALDLGKAVHAFLFDDADEIARIVVRPDEFPDYRTKAAREWRDAQRDSGNVIVDAPVLKSIRRMHDALEAEPGVAALLTAGEPEKSIIWQDAETGIWLKARPDRLPSDGILADLKTTRDASPRGVQRSLSEYGYHMQMALAAEGLEAVGRAPVTDAWLVFVESSLPHCVTVARIGDEMMEFGRMQCRRALRRIADGLNTGRWPGYFEGPTTAYPPDYYFKRLTNEFEQGALA